MLAKWFGEGQNSGIFRLVRVFDGRILQVRNRRRFVFILSMKGASSATTQTLLQRATAGDEQAVDLLFARYAPALKRWASGRLPKGLRDISDTQDIVQDAMLQTFRNLHGFEYRGEGGSVGEPARDQLTWGLMCALRGIAQPPAQNVFREAFPISGHPQ